MKLVENGEYKITEIKIKNFKSLKDVKIELKGFNLLVGRNGAGKTNIIEAFKLLREIRRSPDFMYYNPFHEWRGYQNVVWRGEEKLPITLSYKLHIQDYEIYYDISVTGIGGRFEVLRESVSVSNVVNIIREGNKVIIKHAPEFIESVWNGIKSFHLPPFLWKSISKESKDSLIYQEYELQDSSPWKLLPYYGYSAHYNEGIAIMIFSIPTKNGSPPILVSPVIEVRRMMAVRKFGKSEMREEIHREPLIGYVLFPPRMQNILVLKQLNFKAISEPHLVKREIMLSEDGSNLANVLHTMYTDKGGIPPKIQRVIRYIFGDLEIGMHLTEDGRVQVQVYEDGYPLQGSMIPDGFWKVLSILVAIELKPTLILIDELENSLHPEAIEYIVYELKNSGCTVIASTHSPAVVDIVEPEDLILVERDIEEGTKVERIKDVEAVKRWLRERGITLSEGWLYGSIFSEEGKEDLDTM
jgi:predicted ATPase